MVNVFAPKLLSIMYTNLNCLILINQVYFFIMPGEFMILLLPCTFLTWYFSLSELLYLLSAEILMFLSG